MTGDEEKLFHKMEYKGSWMVVSADNKKLLIKSIGHTVIMPRRNPSKVELQSVMHVEAILEEFDVRVTTNKLK